jgi:hypothetical protein
MEPISKKQAAHILRNMLSAPAPVGERLTPGIVLNLCCTTVLLSSLSKEEILGTIERLNASGSDTVAVCAGDLCKVILGCEMSPDAILELIEK